MRREEVTVLQPNAAVATHLSDLVKFASARELVATDSASILVGLGQNEGDTKDNGGDTLLILSQLQGVAVN